jgi:hypothetical protein
MRSYLRMAVYYPGRCVRVVREIGEVLKVGVTYWPASDFFGHAPPMIPPKGRTRPDCLLAMVPYLGEFENSGYREAPAAPDSAWEWREHYPNLCRVLVECARADGDMGRGLVAAEPYRVAAARRELAELRETWVGVGGGGGADGWAAEAARVTGLGASPARDAGWFGALDAAAREFVAASGWTRAPGQPDPAYAVNDVRCLG